MRLHLGLGLLTLTVAGLVAPASAHAAMASCMSPDGSCEISNVPDDMLNCMCADGSGGGYGGGNMWAGLSDMELQPVCDAELASFCGGAPPPPPGLVCATMNGTCEISNSPFDYIDCLCSDGTGFGYGGGNMWAGLSDPELIMICEGIANTECMGGPPPPPPSAVECSSRLGTCVVDNVPEDSVDCQCADGGEVGGVGGNMWAGLSEGEMLMVCEDQIVELCGEEGGTTSGDTGDSGGDTGDGSGDSTGGGEGTSTGHGDSGEDTGGESDVGESGEGTTGGPGETDGGSEDSGGSGGGEGGGGGGCSVAPRGASGGLALALLGLLGLGRRRRRRAA